MTLGKRSCKETVHGAESEDAECDAYKDADNSDYLLRHGTDGDSPHDAKG